MRLLSKLPTWSRDKTETLLLLLACSVVLLPHALHLSTWVTLSCLAMLLWRSYLTLSGRRLPPPWLLLPVATALMLAVYLTQHSLFGREVGVTMLSLLLTCKLLEMHAKRDLFVVTSLAFFLLLSNYFYQQSIAIAVLSLLALTLLLCAQMSFHYSVALPPLRQRLQLAATLVGLAVPLCLCAFVLFPRISGPLWSLPGDAHAGKTGLSSAMAPGGISDLAQSEELVFRVKFDRAIANKSWLYWRAIVMSDFDGRSWHASATSAIDESAVEDAPALQIGQDIVLEPQGQSWLFALDLPLTGARNGTQILGKRNHQDELRSNTAVTERLRYQVRSAPNAQRAAALTRSERADATELPPNYNPRTLALAAELARTYPAPATLIQAVLMKFRQEAFSYTLEPPLLGRNSVDDFLFVTRAGFCEHFASAFVVLMRAADIPARVVTGYQGGRRNDVDGFYEIRQSDAHAWAEVWLDGTGWTRVDPTAAVAPERVMQNLARALPSRGLAALVGNAWSRNSWAQNLRMHWDAMNHAWNQRVLAYNQQSQLALLASLGWKEVDWAQLALLFFGIAAGLLALLALPIMRNKAPLSKTNAVYLAFCRRMASKNCPKHLAEGPSAYLQRLEHSLPPHAYLPAQAFLRCYIALTYGKPTLTEAISVKQLKTLLAACR
ncbi:MULTISPECIES: DUF3488 and transglutaminase-like domain-containing protein [unclassified Undibacterium]|uniref:transglutaminase TgpA family protein n=2 Tax=Bacteria TaxID=2 RepID=UPI002AC9B84E|nr:MULTISPECIES: DUF3488 and transglutaminase-like domain-containing protein [unclassified Undibacterium]MEB0139567.1 DUF3488 and transglutaminase-like domain-containing protein [Undibacterium sp. CCC2.1]MEB0172502.1 DUF3488 and transglutaminase-like domain-containing protein [Undibacterium sp. CCC1.1]MEB0176520.1 DUF3488 and transglutaminase-like domain-containing protein [Undibacterium sp. CCC3.4]MEB0215626.1 DUF3488 and transglutaminase-like domain-containing protein [Undibacterium sp. 5I2]